MYVPPNDRVYGRPTPVEPVLVEPMLVEPI